MAISTGFERRYGVLERLAATPLGKPGLLAGKVVGIVAIMAFQLLVISTAAALYIGWRPGFTAPSGAVAVAVVILAAGTFANLALALGRPAPGGGSPWPWPTWSM